MKLSETTILTISSIITGVAALFALIGLTTPKWLRTGYGLWNCNDACSPASAALSIIALLLLVTSLVLLVILVIHLFPRKFRVIPVGLMFIATLFLLIATATYLRRFAIIGYSFELIVTAHAFAYIASVLLAFWFGTTINEKSITNTTTTTTMRSNIAVPTVVMPPSRVL